MWLKAFITLTPNSYFDTVPVSLKLSYATQGYEG